MRAVEVDVDVRCFKGEGVGAKNVADVEFDEIWR